MHYTSVRDLCTKGASQLAKGPIALILAEDEVELGSTLQHHIGLGFASVIAVMPASFTLADEIAAKVVRVDHDLVLNGGHVGVINTLIAATPGGTWLYYCFNAEYLFYPFCESRSIGEMLSFQAEERRDATLTYVIDLYASDLSRHSNAVALDDAWLDRSSYYALARPAPDGQGPKERQLDFFGGLRWRFEEHIPADRHRIDRIALFRTKNQLKLREGHIFSDEEYNTYACPWHNNLTAVIASFRTAKALRRNPGSAFNIHTFKWRNSTRFEWHSRQLLTLGLMEPGQWF